MKKLALLASLGALSVAAPAAMASDVFAMNLRGTANLRQFPANDPSQIGNIVGAGFSTFAMDFNSAATSLYAIRNTTATTWDLVTIDTATAVPTLVAPIAGLTGNPSGLSVDPTTETFYVSTPTGLFTLDPMSGSLTSIGTFGGGSTLMIDIAIDAMGNMYGHDIGTDSLYSIDKATGAATVIGVTGLNANFAQGMDFDYATNTLYAAIYIGGGVGNYVSIDVATGTATTLGLTTSFNVEMEMAVRSAVPAPGALALLGLGGLAATRRRR